MFKGKKILVVDDEPDLREILRDEFQLDSAHVQEAQNGIEAFELVKKNKFDLVVTDIRMPGGDGIDLAKNIKTLNADSPAVILITGFADISPEEAYDLGVEVFYAKPFHLDSFRQSVERVLKPLSERLLNKSSSPTSIQIDLPTQFDDALKTGFLHLGRGGAFVKIEAPQFRPGDEVQLKIGDFEGSGNIKWVRIESTPGYPAGVGLEFLSLNQPSFVLFDSWLKAHQSQSYIPRR